MILFENLQHKHTIKQQAIQNNSLRFKRSQSKQLLQKVKNWPTKQCDIKVFAEDTYIQSSYGSGNNPPKNPYYKTTGDNDENNKENKSSSKSRFTWRGWEERVAADPNFKYKVLVEMILGVGFSLVGDMAARPNWGLNELEFVFCTFMVCMIVNFSLMYILAPTIGTSGMKYSQLPFLQKFFGEQTLQRWGAPGGNMYEPGYSIPKRLLNFLFKGLNFSVMGFGAGLIGTGTSNLLIEIRKKFDPNFVSQNESPDILKNAGTWGVNMGLSSNFRYQTLNGLDMMFSKMLPGQFFKVYSIFIRAGNNVLGGLSFVFFAKLFGVQKSEPNQKASIQATSS